MRRVVIPPSTSKGGLKINNISFRQTTGAMSVKTAGAMSALKPTLKEIERYRDELNSNVKPEKFFEYYSKSDWKLGGEFINDWKALFRSWDKNERRQPSKTEQKRNGSKYAIYGEDPEFTSYVDWFNAGGWKEIWKKIAGDNYKEKYEEQTGEKWIGE